MTEEPRKENQSWVWRRVILEHKDTGKRVRGVIIKDRVDDFTQFQLDNGEVVSAKDWFWTLDKISE